MILRQLLPVTVVLCACSNSDQMRAEGRHATARSLETKDAGAPPELLERIAQCEQELETARIRVSESAAALERALESDPAESLRQQLMASDAERRKLEVELAEAAQALAEARREVDSRDYEEALEELADVRVRLARLAAERAALPSSLSVQIAFTIGGMPLALEMPYQTALGRLRFARLRYWLSNVSLVRPDGSLVDIPSSYFLMEVSSAQQLRGGTQKPLTLPAKRRETVELAGVPAGDYVALAFHVGVDAEHNDDLSLTGGELALLKNMAAQQWMWFTSYIFTQLEANIAASDETLDDGGVAPDTIMFWENGTNDDLRRVELALPHTIHVGLDYHPRVEIALEVERLFAGLEAPIDAARTASPTSPASVIGAFDADQRARLADNWRSAFRLQNVRHGLQ